MRPDKHKKKHHATYAKKAAQKNKINGKTSTETTETSSQSHHIRDRPKPKTNDNVLESNVTTGSSGTGNTDQVRDEFSSVFNRNSSENKDNLTSFSRRNIESNWQQYHELPEEEQIVDQRGADFTLLLAQTAGSQFRFKDEETLDEDTTQDDPSSLLSFDCNELAQKLLTISLPERLDISRTIFDLEMLEILDQDAATSKTVTDNRINTTDQQSLPSTQEENNTTCDYELEDILARSQADQSILNQSIQADRDPSLVSNSRLQASSVFQSEEKAEEETHKKDLISNKASNPATTSSLSEDNDDELDFLLSLRSPEGNKSHHSQLKDETPDISRPQEETLAPLSRLDKDDTQELKPSVLSKSFQNPLVESSDVQADSLDDWLDSILDD